MKAMRRSGSAAWKTRASRRAMAMRVDDQGGPPRDGDVGLVLGARGTQVLTAAQLEAGADGAVGRCDARWSSRCAAVRPSRAASRWSTEEAATSSPFPALFAAVLACASLVTAHAQGTYGDLRLAGSATSTPPATDSQGRVEVFLNGEWGTVCDDDWDLRDARVACRQLGYLDALEAPHLAIFGQGIGPIHLDDVNCSGTEARLVDCPATITLHDCGHAEDASAVCDTSASATVMPTAVTVSEEDADGGQYVVELDEVPLADATLTIAGASGTDVSTSPSSLTFTPANWNVRQTVTVTAAHDADSDDETVTLTHSASGGGYDLASIPDVVVTVLDNDGSNRAPTFEEGASAIRSVAENTTSNTAIGAPVAASDEDLDSLTYAMTGTGAAKFALNSSDGQLRTNAALDHEDAAAYFVTITVDDGSGGTDAINVTIEVTDTDEPPAAPARPTLASRTRDSLTMRWTAPANAGRPVVDSYDLQYRLAGNGSFTAGPQHVAGTRARLTGLTLDTEYEVQVRATNDEGDGDWSASATERTEPAASPDATLKSLAVGDAILTPAFDPAITAYATDVDASVMVVTITAVPNHARASVASEPADDDTAAGIQIPVSLGANAIVVTVTAENGAEQSYRITVTRAVYCTAVTRAVTAVEDPPSAGLISDCNILMAAKPILEGSGSPGLDWSVDAGMADWMAVEVSAGRVTKLDTKATIQLFSHSLRGVIPPELGNLSALTLLRLNSVGLQGSIPDELGDLVRLTVLDLASNRDVLQSLRGLDGPIPESLGNLEKLEILNLNNNALSGEIPPSLGRLSSLEVLNLGRNIHNNIFGPVPPFTGFTGRIPQEIGQLSNLTKLYLNDNYLTGIIPRVLGELADLVELELEFNYLGGCIPGSLGRFAADINPQTNTGSGGPTRNLSRCPVPNRATATVVSALDGEIVVSYRAGLPPLAKPVIRYEYRLSLDGGATWTPDWTAIPDSGGGGANATSYTLTGLANGTEYTFEIRAVNIDGAGRGRGGTATPRPRSSDATLRDLMLSAGSSSVALNPDFAPDGLTYTAIVGVAGDTLTIVATPTDANATVDSNPVDDDAAAGIQVPLSAGFNDIVVTVTAENGTQLDYRLTVIRNPTDDPPGVAIEPTSLSLDEGTTAGYTVTLAAQPVEAVTVAVDGTPTMIVTASPSRLTFTTSNWHASQTVNVAAAMDTDTEDESAVLTHTATGAGYDSLPIADVTVSVIDVDIPGVTLSETTLRVAEGGSVQYTLVLDTGPTAAVTVTASASDVDVGPTSLTFTPGNWQTAQTVTVSTEVDDDAEDDVATVTHAASGGGYGGIAVAFVRITIEDGDTNGVTLSSPTLTVEESASATYTVVLDTEPTGPVTVAAHVPSASDIHVEPSTLAFTPSTWRTARTVTVRADADDDVDDDTATVTHTASGGGYGGVLVADVVVTVSDDDTAGVVLSTTSLGLTENGEATYTAHLTAVPDGTATLAMSLPSGSDVSVAPSELTFAIGDWETAQTVTVRAADDDDTENDQATIGHSVSGGDYDGVAVADVAVTVTDDDTAGVTLSATTLTVDEGGRATYTIRLATQPSATAMIAMSVPSGSDVGVSPASLTFAVGDWQASKTVTVTAAEDDDAADGQATVSHQATGGGYDGVAVPDLAVAIADNDAAGVTLSATALILDEGDSATYSVVLNTRPTGSAILTAGIRAGADVVLSPTTLTFTPTNWQTGQTVTVEAGQDDDAEDDAETVDHAASGGGYGSVAIPGIAVRVNDDDVNGVTLSATSLSLVEGGNTAYTAVLDAQPTGPVTVTAGAPSGSDVTVSPASLTFTPTDWSTAQTVAVSAAQDDDTRTDRTTVSHAASGGGYGGVTVADVVVTVTDDDTAGVALSATTLSVDEGGSATYTVALSTVPTGSVTLAPRVETGSSVATSPVALTFTTADWQTAQTVTVTAAEDADAQNGAATVTHSARGGGYAGVQIGSVAVTIVDDDSGSVPQPERSQVQAETVSIGFDRSLDRSSVPSKSDFAVEIAGDGIAMERIDVLAVGVAEDVVTLTLARAVEPGERPAVTYTPGTYPIRSVARIDALGFTVHPVPPAASAGTARSVLLFESAADPARQGFVRIINHSAESGEVSIEAVDDSGMRAGPIALTIGPGAAAHFNSDDLESGNADKGLPDGVGPASLGDWRLELASELDIEVLSYARTADGFVTSLHDAVPVEAGVHRGVVFFNPGDNIAQESRLRLLNPGIDDATVTITGTDDEGKASGEVRIVVFAGAVVDLTAEQLEDGTGRGVEEGALGYGEGKWRLRMVSDAPITAMNLLDSQGRLTNLSTAPQTAGNAEGSRAVLLFPSASDPDLQGFVRVINRSAEAGEVRIEAFDDTDRIYEPVTLAVEAGEAAHFNSDDLELGNPDKGLTGSTGAGQGDWRLELSSDLDIEVLAYIRTDDGFVTAMHDLAPEAQGVHRVVFLNPASNVDQVSRVRLVNPGATDAAVTLTGIDSAGASPGEPVLATVRAGTALELTSAELESGEGDGIDAGALGDGLAKWRLAVESDQPIHVMSLLRSPTGHLTNLSTSPNRDPE